LLVAIATDKNIKPQVSFADDDHMPLITAPMYGQDITSYTYRIAPGGQSVGKTAEELKPKMRALLRQFAAGDRSGMSTLLFDKFLTDTCRLPQYFDNKALNKAANEHTNIQFFCNAAVSAPNTPNPVVSKTRIHQALKAANWDITKSRQVIDLGVPAFNIGSKVRATEDFSNGLGVMINGVQHVYVIATHYAHDAEAKKYSIRLKYIFYDVFGLDDDDLREYGASSDSVFSSVAAVGITAWWQLQHQLGYTPLVTRIVLEKTFEAPAV
jgi:hypothetical protein